MIGADGGSVISLRDFYAAHASDRDIERILVEHREQITRQQARMYHGQRMADVAQAFAKAERDKCAS